jgi:2-iminobutanoate/2-iminopropanoate deaminase
MNTVRSRWSLAGVLVALFVVVLPSLVGTPTVSAEERRVVKLAGTSSLPFSDGVIAGDTLYVAGQEGIDANGKLVLSGIGAETKATLGRIE